MKKYVGCRVVQGPTWNKPPLGFVGSILYDDSCKPDDTVFVQWDNGISNNYAIGYENKYNLLLYDSSIKGPEHENFFCKGCTNQKSIVGTVWSCLECSGIYMCTSCYMSQTIHADHNFCRIDFPNKMGYFVGLLLKDDKYQGIIKNSNVITTAQLEKSLSGNVESIDFNYEKKRPSIKVILSKGTNSKTFKKYPKLKLLEDNLSPSIFEIDKNHLKVLGHNPIFNYQLCQHYKERLNKFSSEFLQNESEFTKGDKVYIDCLSTLDLKEFQKGKGEWNNKIEKLIGEPGVVEEVTDSVVRIYFDTIQEVVPINKSAVFNIKSKDEKIIRIIDDIGSIKLLVKEWIEKFDIKTHNQKWYPNDSIFEKILGKVGVIIMNDLPDNLVVIRFKLYRHSFCILLPKGVCINLEDFNDKSSRQSQPEINLELSAEEAELYEIGKEYIENDNNVDFEVKMTNLRMPLWSQLFNYSIENDKRKFMTIMLNLPNSSLTANSFLLKGLSKHIEWTSDVVDLILNNIIIDFGNTTSDGDNILHLAAKNDNCEFVEKMLSMEKYDNIINLINKKTDFTAFHYAVVNNHLDMVRILIEKKCDIYSFTNEKFTGLRIALQHYYLEVFLIILEIDSYDLEKDLDDKINTILHLAARLPDKDVLNRWKNMITKEGENNLKKLIVDLKEFIKIFEFDFHFDVEEAPFFVLSCFLLQRGKNVNRIWNHEINTENKTPAKIFNESTIKNAKDNPVTTNHILRLFKIYQNDNEKMKMCQFCKADFARVTYKPCGHILHCSHCAAMPYKCAECNEFIKEKYFGGKEMSGFEAWTELAKDLHNSEYPENMNDWLVIVKEMLQKKLCLCCRVKPSTLLIVDCGHCICKDCKNNTEKCPNCQQIINKTVEMK